MMTEENDSAPALVAIDPHEPDEQSVRRKLYEVRDDLLDALRQMTSGLKRTWRHAARAGRFLVEAKAQLEHGKFLNWLKLEVQIPPRTAQELMRLARFEPDIEDFLKANTRNGAPLTFTDARRVITALEMARRANEVQDEDEDSTNEPITIDATSMDAPALRPAPRQQQAAPTLKEKADAETKPVLTFSSGSPEAAAVWRLKENLVAAARAAAAELNAPARDEMAKRLVYQLLSSITDIQQLFEDDER